MKNDRCDITLRPYKDFDYPYLLEIERSGTWSCAADTFVVEELPLYPFVGEGEHAALIIQKKDQTTRDLALKVADMLKLPAASVGYAGMKDKASLTTQAFTVTACKTPDAVRAFEQAGAKVLTATRHANKLRLGHLAANRFSVFLHDVDAAQAKSTLEKLSQMGVPNFYGPQRFGSDGDNARQGFDILAKNKKIGRWKRDLCVSALQSLIFNENLARRMENGQFFAALEGDVLQKLDSGGVFVCEDPALDAPRVEAFEISPTGPMHGGKGKRPTGAVLEGEEGVLADMGLAEALFSRETGSRRAFREKLEGAGVREGENGAWLDFILPPGVFATSVVREVTGKVFRV